MQKKIWTFSKKDRRNDTSTAISTSSTQILVSEPLSNKKDQGYLEKWLILELRKEKYMINHENFVVPNSKRNVQNRIGHVNDKS